jgi:predicted ATPase/DNA-binding SARP family transcriptional activator
VATHAAGSPDRRGREGGADAGREVVFVELFGRARHRIAGAWSPLQPDRRGQLLAVLTLADDWVERDYLADLFWRTLPQDAGRRNLRHLVHTIQKRGGAPCLEANRGALRWRVASDVADFDDALVRGDWARAVALHRGPLLYGFEVRATGAFGEWVESEREQRRLRWRAAALEWARTTGDAVAIAEALRPLVEGDLDEEALLVVLDVLERSGERVRARMLLDAFHHRVGELFGIEPGAKVRLRLEASVGAGPVPAVEPDPSTALVRISAATTALAPLSDAVPLVGRDAELLRLESWHHTGERLVTIVGPGGIGKSRLARAHLAARDPAAARTIVAPVGAASGERYAADAIARAAGALLDDGESVGEALNRALGETTEFLLLDDVERASAVAGVTVALLRARPALRVVVTALEPLRVVGERVLPLAGLDYGGAADLPPDLARRLPAVILFAALASRHDPDRSLGEHDVAAVRAIAAAVDGSPLGLELAAPWVRSLPLWVIARHIAGDPDFLSTPEREGPSRQRSLRAAFQHAAGLLTVAERAALVRLSLLDGSFSREAAVLVARVPLPVLASLVDRSLVRADADHRYALPRPVRAFARETLATDPGTERATLGRLVRYAAGLLRAGFPVDGFPNADAVAVADREHTHLVAACRAAVALGRFDDAARLAYAIATTGELRGRIQEGLDALDAALAADGSSGRRSRRRRGRLLVQRAWLYHWADPEAGVAAAVDARAALSSSDLLGHAWVLRTLGVARWRAGAYAEAESHLRSALTLTDRAGHAGWRAVLLDGLGLCLAARGAFADGEAALREALALNERHDNPFQATQNLINLASAARVRGDGRAAVAYAGRAVEVARRILYVPYVAHALTQLAACALAAGDPIAAAAAAEEAVATAARSGDGYIRIWSALVEAEVLEVGDLHGAAAALGRGLGAALAGRDRKQLLHGTAIAARFAVDRGDHDTAALALAIVRSEPSTPVVVRRQVEALLRMTANDIGLTRRRGSGRFVRRVGLEDAVHELRVRVAAWNGIA